MSKAKKAKINRLRRQFEEASQELDDFMEDHQEIMDELRQKSTLVNIHLDKLKRACREYGISAGPLKVSKSRKRIFDGLYLFNKFKNDPEILEELVTVEYKVDTDAFDKLVQSGEIDPKDASKAVKDVKVINRVLNSPKDIVI